MPCFHSIQFHLCPVSYDSKKYLSNVKKSDELEKVCGNSEKVSAQVPILIFSLKCVYSDIKASHEFFRRFSIHNVWCY